MGIVTVDASTDVSNHGTDADVTDIQEGTAILHVRPSSIAAGSRGLIAKSNSTGTTGWFLIKQNSDGTKLQFGWNRATTDMSLISLANSISVANIPWWVAVTWSISGGTAIIYTGGAPGVMVNVSGGPANAGSGAVVTDASDDLCVANVDGGSLGYPGETYYAALFKQVLSEADIEAFTLNPGTSVSGIDAEMFVWYGNAGTGTQVDETGNGHDGTITGATQAVPGPVLGKSSLVGSRSPLFRGTLV